MHTLIPPLYRPHQCRYADSAIIEQDMNSTRQVIDMRRLLSGLGVIEIIISVILLILVIVAIGQVLQ
jgi:hypothetical protein